MLQLRINYTRELGLQAHGHILLDSEDTFTIEMWTSLAR